VTALLNRFSCTQDSGKPRLYVSGILFSPGCPVKWRTALNQDSCKQPFLRIRERRRELLQSLNQIKIGEGSMEAIDVAFSVGRYQDWSDGGDTGGVDRNDLLPNRFLSCG